MNILLTNDDGILAEGIYPIYKELKKLGNVTVVAPDSERSSVGHGITLGHPIWYKKFKRDNKPFGYGISGTPADCVKFAISVLMKKKPDLVVSGINLGPNDGCSVFYSGTVAGAREGALLNIPSIALSLGTFFKPDFSFASKFGAKVAKAVLKQKMPKGTFLNVNVPNVPKSRIKGVRLTRQCTVPIDEVFKKRRDPNFRDYFWMSGKSPKIRPDLNVDTSALAQNYVTVTPIHSDLTDYSFLEEISSWKI